MKKNDIDLFFKNLTNRAGAYDEEAVKAVYYGMVKMVTDGFRNCQPVELPHLGTFSVRQRKGRMRGDVHTGGKVYIPPTREVKFDPFYAFKEYVKQMQTKLDEKGD